MSRSLGTRVVAATLLLCLGCAGTESYVRARGPLDGPVSLTGSVYDSDGRLLTLSDGLRKVGDFNETHRVWSLFYFIGWHASWDVTHLVNRRLAEAGGDAVIDLEVDVRGAPYMGIAMFLFVIPSYFDVHLKGTIVAATP